MANRGRALAGLCGLSFLVACARDERQPNRAPRIEEPVAHILSSGAGVVYLRVVNDGADDVLESVEAPGAADAQLHEVVAEGELSVMRAVPDGFPIRAHSSIRLEHGGKHVMLFGVKDPNTVKDLGLVLHFRSAGVLTIDVPVQHGIDGSQASR